MLRIDLASRDPVYEQIANGLRAELVSGQFSPGAKLPTVRTLAIDLGIHHNTVAEAYRQLANEGWLELKRHRVRPRLSSVGRLRQAESRVESRNRKMDRYRIVTFSVSFKFPKPRAFDARLLSLSSVLVGTKARQTGTLN